MNIVEYDKKRRKPFFYANHFKISYNKYMKITTLIENTTKSTLHSEHGLSFYIEFENKNYLLDSGSSSLFIENAKQLNIDVNNVMYAILSHGHYDHSGGFLTYLKHNNVKVVAASGFEKPYYSTSGNELHYIGVNPDLYKTYKKRFLCMNKPFLVNDRILFIPHFLKTNTNKHLFVKVKEELILDDFSHEATLVFATEKGLVVMNSCSHAGLDVILEEVKTYLPMYKIHTFIGGLHMKGKKDGNEICTFSEEAIKALCTKINEDKIHVYTGHCTGKVAYEMLKKYSPEYIHDLYSGKVIEI